MELSVEPVFATICIVGIVVGAIAIFGFTVTDGDYLGGLGITLVIGLIMAVTGGIGWYNASQDAKHAAEQESGLVIVDQTTAGKRTYDRVGGVDGCKLPVELRDGKFYIANSENSAPLTQQTVDYLCSGGPR